MIYITGDTHGDFRRFSNRRMRADLPGLTEKDYIIICGDFGMCWEHEYSRTFEFNKEFFSAKPYTILWVQGNHENYDMLEAFELEEWNGGKARHIVRDKVILLERGQVFNIEGNTFFTFGGASSHDISGGVLDRKDPNFALKKKRASRDGLPYRILRESWWPQELPTEEEMQEGLRNLEKVDYKVDYVITHCCATSVQDLLDSTPGSLYDADILTDYFQTLEEKLTYRHWYFGHYHDDKPVDEKHTLLYHFITKLGDADADYAHIPKLGHPKYGFHEEVVFLCGNEEITGRIDIIDAFGTFDQNDEPSYDIYREENNTLYKHIPESFIVSRKGE